MHTTQFWPKDLLDGGAIVRYPADQLAAFGIPESAVRFLGTTGLPEGVAPSLYFWIADDGHLSTVAEEWDVPKGQAEEWKLSEEFDKFVSIGTTAAGDPITITPTGEGELYILNHDNDFEPTFLNSSPQQLAACLILFHQFVEDVVKENGPDAWREQNIPEHLQAQFEAALRATDSRATQRNGFWQG